MKTNFVFQVPSVDIPLDDKTFKTPGVTITFGTEYDKEEFIALLPHYQEMAKLIFPYLIETRNQLLNWWRDVGSGLKEMVIPGLMEMAKAHSDSALKAQAIGQQIRLKEATQDCKEGVKGF